MFILTYYTIVEGKISVSGTTMEYDPKGMPFRRLGPSGLRVPLFSLGGCELLLEQLRTLTNPNFINRDNPRRNSQGWSSKGIQITEASDWYVDADLRICRISLKLHLKMVSICLILPKNIPKENQRKRCTLQKKTLWFMIKTYLPQGTSHQGIRFQAFWTYYYYKIILGTYREPKRRWTISQAVCFTYFLEVSSAKSLH